MRFDQPFGERPSDDEAIALLRDLVAIPSLSGHEQAAVEYLVGAMRRLGMEARVDATGNAVGSVGTGRPEILLVGHIDTVAGAIPVKIAGGKLHGRGTVDAKGSLAAFTAAAARLRASDMPAGRVVVIGCVEEEAPSSRGAHGILDEYRPDYCIVGEPSGAETITLGYKGSVRARIRIRQPSGHSAHNRTTVAERASDLWQELRAWATAYNAGMARSWDQLLPALVGINSDGDGLHDWCDLELSLRLPEAVAPAAAAARLRELAGDGEVTVLGAVPAFRAPRTSALARAMIGSLKEQGIAARFVVKTGTSDMNLVGPAWECPIVTYGPGDASLDHTADEHIVVADYLRSIRVLEGTLRRLLAPAEPTGELLATNCSRER